MPSFTLPDSRSVAYALDGPDDAPLVLLCNSLTTPYTAWDHVVEFLNEIGLRTLRYDQPGHGGSSAPSSPDTTSFESLADDAHALLSHLGITVLHGWVGVSMGAATGIYFVDKYPGIVRRFAVCDTIASSPVNAGVPDLFGPRVTAARAAGNMRNTVEQTLERWFGAPWLAAHAAGEAERMRTEMMRTTIEGFDACCVALRSESFDLRPRLRAVGRGVEAAVCVVGEKDADLPQAMQKMRAEIEQGFRDAGKEASVKLEVVKDAGHVCFIDGFEQFCLIMSSFLRP